MKQKTRQLTTIGMLCALAFVVSFFKIPVILWLKYEPKDVIIAIGGFVLGPVSATIISFLAALIEFPFSETGLIGAIMNAIASCAFVCPAAILYKRRHTLRYAAIGLVSGVIVATGVMLRWNYFLTPLYMGYPREAVAELLIPAFLPFNLLKTGLNTAFTLLLYKPAVTALRRAKLMPDTGISGQAPTKKERVGAYLLAFFLLITGIVAILVMQGVI